MDCQVSDNESLQENLFEWNVRRNRTVVTLGMLDQRKQRARLLALRTPTGTAPQGSIRSWRKTLVGELTEVAVVTVLLVLVIFGVVPRIAVQNFRVQGHSMMPTLRNGEFLLVDKLSYDFTSPARGDIVVLRDPWQPEDLIKRVIAVPGDRVTIRLSAVYINGRRLHEPYTIHPYPRKYAMPTIPFHDSSLVPPHDYFVLGDNRNYSDDSHMWGLVPRKDIIGRAVLAYWPIQRLGVL